MKQTSLFDGNNLQAIRWTIHPHGLTHTSVGPSGLHGPRAPPNVATISRRSIGQRPACPSLDRSRPTAMVGTNWSGSVENSPIHTLHRRSSAARSKTLNTGIWVSCSLCKLWNFWSVASMPRTSLSTSSQRGCPNMPRIGLPEDPVEKKTFYSSIGAMKVLRLNSKKTRKLIRVAAFRLRKIWNAMCHVSRRDAMPCDARWRKCDANVNSMMRHDVISRDVNAIKCSVEAVQRTLVQSNGM